MFHIGGDSHIWPFFLMGGCNVIIPEPSFDPAAVLQSIVDEQITDVHIVPTQLVALLNLPDIANYDLGRLKRIWYAASPMPTEVLKRGLEVFGPIFIQGYGLTIREQADQARNQICWHPAGNRVSASICESSMRLVLMSQQEKLEKSSSRASET
jgi:acyl-CoA synthetase (AMP-forming)/AMP-acid ligase II